MAKKKNKNPKLPSDQEQVPVYKPNKEELELNDALDKRAKQLKKHRKDVDGINIDKIMNLADDDIKMKMHNKAERKSKLLVANNDDLGWRGTSSFVDLGEDDWQSDAPSVEPYVKLMVALSILFDNDPQAVLEAGGKKYGPVVEVYKQLYENSWRTQYSRETLKSCIFDLGRYGWMVGRTALSNNTRTIREAVEVDPESQQILKVEEKELQDFTTVKRMRLNPKRVWLDDAAKANDHESIGDWLWEMEYSEDKLMAEFGHTPNFEFIPNHGTPFIDQEDDSLNPSAEKASNIEKSEFTVQFYENKYKDQLVARVHAGSNGWIPLVNEPLPYDHKRLSLWTTYWNMRNPDTPYGIGPIEIMREDKNLLNKVKNMTIDQLVLSIYKMFFYENKGAYRDKSKIQIKPGVGEEIKGKITFLEVPGPGEDAYRGWDRLQEQIDNATGITKPLTGEVTGKTAFEVGQAKESALKRLKLPLDNITYALDIEAPLTVDLMYQAYTMPIVEKIVDQDDIQEYLKSIQNDPRLYQVELNDDETVKEFYAKRYKEFALGVKMNTEKSMYVPTGENKAFFIMPDFVRWNGDIKVRSQSLVATWKELEKSQISDFARTVIELLEIGPEKGMKPIMQLAKVHNQDPKDWIPDSWLNPQKSPEQKMGEEIFGEENLPEGEEGESAGRAPARAPVEFNPGDEINRQEAPLDRALNV